MTVYDLINKDIICSCGRTHHCNISELKIGAGVLDSLSDTTAAYSHILLVADSNTYKLCGDRVKNLISEKLDGICIFETDDLLVPDERSIETIESHLSENTDLILGIGSGVINDLCKYVSFFSGIKSGIIATATSMDGYASSGAAMIIGGMKVTYNTHAPDIIIGDTDILKGAPIDMIRAGYGDIIGKYSALCDWKLSALINGEYLCPFVYDIVKDKTDEIRSLAKRIISRDPEAIGKLMETLVLIGACLTLLSTTRPGSGSEHHLSHFFEITGLIENKPYFLHGTDVAYATIVTAGLREEIVKISDPTFYHISEKDRIECYKKIYRGYYSEVRDIQDKAGRYLTNSDDKYKALWNEVLSILRECPTSGEIEEMLCEVGFDLSAFEAMYGAKKIRNSVWFGKDLKDRYSVLWLYCDLFLNGEEIQKIMKPDTFDHMRRSVEMEISTLRSLYESMDRDAFEKAIELLKASPLIVTSACGSSCFATQKFAHALCCIEHPAKYVPPSEAVHGGMGALPGGGTLVLVSKGGKTEELIPLANIAKRKNGKVIAVTANPDSELARLADVVLLLPKLPESDRYGVMSTTSFCSTMSVFNALMVGLMEEDDYQLSTFSLIHPGGAVGKQIN